MAERTIIKPLSGIRAFYALLIVFIHMEKAFEIMFKVPPFLSRMTDNSFCVMGFMMLSGFLTAMHYGAYYANEEMKSKALIKNAARFTLNHAKKWYLLYLVALLPFIKLIISRNLKTLVINSGIFLANVLMLQSVLPYPYSTFFNGVEWYISSLFFLYFFAPFLLKLNSRINKNLLLNVLIGLGFVFITYVLTNYIVLYSMPVYRIFQFWLGIIVYNIYGIMKEKNIKTSAIVCVLAGILEIIAGLKLHPIDNDEIVNLLIHSLFILSYSTSDFSAPLLTNKITMYLASISLEMYLLHFIVVYYGCMVIFPRLNNPSALFTGIYIAACTALIFGISAFYHSVLPKSKIYQKVNGFIISKFNNLISKLDDKTC